MLKSRVFFVCSILARLKFFIVYKIKIKTIFMSICGKNAKKNKDLPLVKSILVTFCQNYEIRQNWVFV